MVNINKNLFLQPADNIITVTSGVGSMGKTWMAVTLAHALSLLRRKVLLFDADNGLLNTEAQLGVSTEKSLDEVVAEKISFNCSPISVTKKNFDLIAGTAGSNILEEMPVGRLQIFKEYLTTMAHDYDKVVIDLALSEKVMSHFLPASKDLLLVCTSDPSNLVATYNFLQNSAVMLNYENLNIVVNLANSYEEGLQTYNILRRACEQYLKITPALLGVIRKDTKVRDAIRNHALLFNRYPDSNAAADVMQIARKLLKMETENES